MNTSTLAHHSLGRVEHRLTSLTRRLRRNPGDRRLLLEHALLTDGGDWQDGHWFLVDAGTHPCWLTPDGRRVNADHVQGVHFLIPARWSGFASAVDDIDGRIRCHESGDFPAPDMVLTADQVAYCETCQRNVPVVGDPLRYADHDKRGRTIEGEEGRA
jgi:hypothetical protein